MQLRIPQSKCDSRWGRQTYLARPLHPVRRLSVTARASSGPPTGIFLRDLARSDLASYERALELLQLGRLQRLTAVQLIEGIELQRLGPTLSLRFLTVVPFFQITETYKLNSSVAIRRRDLRPGNQQAEATLEPDGTLLLRSSWGPPNAGSLEERLLLSPNDPETLEYVSTLRVAGGEETTRQVYRRVDKWKAKYSWNPIQALQIMAAEK